MRPQQVHAIHPDRSPWGVPSVCLALILMVAAIYAPTLHHEFTNFDDPVFVTGNPHVLAGLNWDTVRWAFRAGWMRGDPGTDYWRPISLISHMIDVQSFGLRAKGHHAVNLLLFSLDTALLFLVLRSLTGAFWRSAVTSALWAVHPLRVESVAWIAERKDLLSGLFFLLTLWAYARYARRPFAPGQYLLMTGCFLFGLMSKPILVTAPFVLLLLDWWPLGRFRNMDPKPLILEKLPLLALSLIVGTATLLAQHGIAATIPLESLSIPRRLEGAAVAYATYLRQTAWPSGLNAYSPLPHGGWPLWEVLVSTALLAVLTFAALRQRNARPYLAVGWFWWVGMLFPVIGILQSGGQAHADRYMFLPQIGLLIAVVWLVADCRPCKTSPLRILPPLLLVLLVLGVVSRSQCYFWRDSGTLWNRVLECDPGVPVAHNDLGAYLLEKGEASTALEHFEQAVVLCPDYAEARYNLGSLLLHCGRAGEAIPNLRRAIALNPGHPESHDNLGGAYLLQGLAEGACEEFSKAIELRPDYPQARNNLGLAMQRLGRYREAAREFREALRGNPASITVQNNLARALASLQDPSPAEASEALRLAQEINRATGDGHPDLMEILAAAYAEIGDFAKALETARRALALAEAAGNKELAQSLRKEIGLYESGKPMRDPVP